jgi:hypothetical protein
MQKDIYNLKNIILAQPNTVLRKRTKEDMCYH